jgi:aryl-alcohol dehydrogenase-like predicted oxidoreductase
MGASTDANAQEPAAKPAELPRRVLGKTGVSVTMLEQGTVLGPGFERIMRQSYAGGVRVFDTAKVYRSEPLFKKWFDQNPQIRKEVFLVTKDMPKRPSQLLTMIDERLEALGTDSIDLLMIHGLGDEHPLDVAMDLVKGKELKETAEALKKSGKMKFIGFSTHHKDRAQIIQAAADGGIVDAIMLQYHPWLDKESPLNKALDACWKKGIGLISMKQIASHYFGDKPKGDILKDVVEKVPMLKERNLTPFQGLLHAIWTDERISSVCVSMRNTDQIRQNIDAARRYEPVKAAELGRLRDVLIAAGPMMCADCDGRCSEAAGTRAELGNLARFLTYHEHHGDRAFAREQYARLAPEARDWSDADLEAARDACPNRLDFASLLPRAERLLG